MLPVANGGESLHPDWSPDGQRLTFVVNGAIWTADVDGSSADEVVARDGLGL